MTRFIILEWVGHWAIPERHSSWCINPGPYDTQEAAQAEIKAYAIREAVWFNDPFHAATEEETIVRRHTVAPVEWPAPLETNTSQAG